MSDMHELIMESTTKIFKDLCTKELVDKVEEGKWAGTLWDVLVESGITSVGVSESVGGTGGDYIDAFHILRLAGKFAVPLPLTETLIVNWLLAEYGEAPKEYPVTFVIDSNNKLELEKTENGYLVNGTILNVPWTQQAKEILVLGSIEGESVITLLPLEKASIHPNSNLAGEPRDKVVFEDEIVGNIVTYVVEKAEILDKIMNLGGLSKAVMMSGAIDRILELSIQYTKEREQFGRPLHRLQAIQQHLAILSGETVAVLASTNQAIEAYDRGIIIDEIANAKFKANQATAIVTEIAHQVHGAIGATHEHRLHQLTRRLWAWREEFGNENDWAEKLAYQVMNSKDQSLWEMITDENGKEIAY